VSKDSVVCLPHKLTHHLGAISPLCLVQRLTNCIHLIDPATTQSKSSNILYGSGSKKLLHNKGTVLFYFGNRRQGYVTVKNKPPKFSSYLRDLCFVTYVLISHIMSFPRHILIEICKYVFFASSNLCVMPMGNSLIHIISCHQQEY